MPRQRFVRLQIQRQTETKGPAGHPKITWPAVEGQEDRLFVNLRPISPQETLQVERFEINAGWTALAREQPEIKNRDRLAQIIGSDSDGDPILGRGRYEVVGSLLFGRHRKLWLRELEAYQ